MKIVDRNKLKTVWFNYMTNENDRAFKICRPFILRVLSIQFPTDAPKHITVTEITNPYTAVSRKVPGASFIIYSPLANHHLDLEQVVKFSCLSEVKISEKHISSNFILS